jgi:hypothetical protein
MKTERWWKARKKPIEVRVREVQPMEDIFLSDKKTWVKGETIKTREGELKAISGKDFLIEGIEGEIYPIGKESFYKTYEILGETSE